MCWIAWPGFEGVELLEGFSKAFKQLFAKFE